VISLEKGRAPSILELKGAAWTRAYVDAVNSALPSRPERWRHREIIEALREEAGARCIYCEAAIEDVSYPHVDHIAPKSLFPERAHQWENLAWACERCNKAKGDFYSENVGLLNPFEDDPLEHLNFVGGMVFPRIGRQRGKITTLKLRLNRSGLLKSRARRLDELQTLVEQWSAAEEPLKGVLAFAIQEDVEDGEFRQSCRAFLSRVDFPLDELAERGGS